LPIPVRGCSADPVAAVDFELSDEQRAFQAEALRQRHQAESGDRLAGEKEVERSFEAALTGCVPGKGDAEKREGRGPHGERYRETAAAELEEQNGSSDHRPDRESAPAQQPPEVVAGRHSEEFEYRRRLPGRPVPKVIVGAAASFRDLRHILGSPSHL